MHHGSGPGGALGDAADGGRPTEWPLSQSGTW